MNGHQFHSAANGSSSLVLEVSFVEDNDHRFGRARHCRCGNMIEVEVYFRLVCLLLLATVDIRIGLSCLEKAYLLQ